MKSFFLLILIVGFVLFLNIFPNYYAYQNTPFGQTFSGQASWFDPWDINVYVSAIKWGQKNGILLKNTYTTEEHSPLLIYPVYTLIGKLFPQTNPFLLFHLSALLAGFILLITLWQFLKIFLPSKNQTLIALFLISLGGGAGWLFFPKIPSADLFMTGFTFLSHFQRAHEGLGVIFYLLSLIFFYLGVVKVKQLFYLFSLVFLLLLIPFYPYYLLSYFLINGLFSGYHFIKTEQAKPLQYLVGNLLINGLVFFLYYQHIQGNPGFSGVLSQKLNTPDLLQIILGYGVLTPLLIYQLFFSKDEKTIFLNLWFWISLSLAFLPFGFARFYLRILFFPAVLLILLNIKHFSEQLKITQKIILITLALVLPISSLYITYKRLSETEKGNPWYYLDSSKQEAFNFLKKTGEGRGVLSSYNFGNLVPAKTSSKVYFGHLLQTPDAELKTQNILKFYANSMEEEQAMQFLDQENIDFIVWGEEEQSILLSTNQSGELKYQFLKPVFQKDNLFIFTP